MDRTAPGRDNAVMSAPKPSGFTIPEAAAWHEAPTLAGLAATVALVGATVAIGLALPETLPRSGLPLIFLLAVLIASARYGFWTGIIASILAFLADNFFFIEPYFTFHVGAVGDWLTLVVLLVAGALTGFLVGRLREEADAARRRARALAVMGDCATALARAQSPRDVVIVLVDALAQLDGGEAVALGAGPSGLQLEAPGQQAPRLSPEDIEAAERAFRRGSPEMPAAPGWTGGRFAFESLSQGDYVVGYTLHQPLRTESRHARQTMIDQANLALDNLALAQSAAAAEASAQREALRAALLSSLSHDLRTPLATILGGISSLREFGSTMPEPARNDTLLAVEQEAERLSRYVGNLLQLTRLRTGLDLRLDWIEAADVMHAAVTRARRAFAGRRVLAGMTTPVPLIRSDAVLLEQALFNLIDNALKFSPPEAPVTVTLGIDDSRLVISVTDAGPGIPGPEQERIFDAFVRGSATSSSGSGLGLAITRGITEALGGTVSVRSPADGDIGTCMRLALSLEERLP